MKKIAPIVALAVIAAFSSCKKQYECTCTTTVNGVAQTPVTGKIATKMTKKDAKAECNKADQTVTSGGVTSSVDCNLK